MSTFSQSRVHDCVELVCMQVDLTFQLILMKHMYQEIPSEFLGT